MGDANNMARTQGHGNPNWTRDETILALDLYLKCEGTVPSADDPRVRDLSDLLRSLPIHTKQSRTSTFRNPAGVIFKLQNLRQVATGRGLQNTSATDRQVWVELGSSPSRIKDLAQRIRRGAQLLNAAEPIEVEPEREFFEGKILTRLHATRERCARVRRDLLRSRQRPGPLRCEMCGAGSPSAAPVYEDAFFEAHHLVPIADAGERRTSLREIALLCAGCHRLIHRAISLERRWLDITEARTVLNLRHEQVNPTKGQG